LVVGREKFGKNILAPMIVVWGKMCIFVKMR